ncbi:MAG: hypothetical protein CMG41_03420 [Candidatus Marinimicrobia bacterium]|nr:hypothetical protein [Candidatus Neomarinimicrobiota bacterium]
MKLLIKFSFLIFGILILESCSVTENTEKYCPEDGCLLVRENPNDRFNEEVAKSDIEQEFEALEVSNDFPYPPEGQSYLKEGLVPRPKKIFSSEGSESVEVRRLGGIYWIYMEALPSKTWPLMKDYLFDNQYNLIFESAESGKITAEKSADKMFVTLEHGIKNNSSEIYLSNEDKTSKDQEFFEQMASYLSENLPGYQGDSIAAQGLNLNKKARIVYVKKEIGIEFRLPFERTWSAISRAVEKAGYEVSDRNRELRYIQIKVKKENTGWLNNLFSPVNNERYCPEGGCLFDGEENVDADYELIFSESEENTLLEFKKLSNTNITVDQLVDEINESLS